jgi:hypothetical protein
LKEEALHRTLWKTRFCRCYGPIVRQTTEKMKVWLTLKKNINTQTDNNWCYKIITHCLKMTKLKHGVQWGCILSKGQCYLEKQWIMTLTFHSLLCIILGITVHNLRIEDNYTSLPELMHRYSWGILKIQIMWKFHFLCKNWKTLPEQKLIIFRDEISIFYQEIFPEFARPA